MNNDNIRFMSVDEVAKILGIGKSLAYDYLSSKDCPFAVVRIKSRYAVPYNSFSEWYENLTDNKK